MKALRLRDVIAVTGLSRMTIYRLEKQGKFPARRQLSGNSVGWLDVDISGWLSALPERQASSTTSIGPAVAVANPSRTGRFPSRE